jgi:hypothetical protein
VDTYPKTCNTIHFLKNMNPSGGGGWRTNKQVETGSSCDLGVREVGIADSHSQAATWCLPQSGTLDARQLVVCPSHTNTAPLT